MSPLISCMKLATKLAHDCCHGESMPVSPSCNMVAVGKAFVMRNCLLIICNTGQKITSQSISFNVMICKTYISLRISTLLTIYAKCPTPRTFLLHTLRNCPTIPCFSFLIVLLKSKFLDIEFPYWWPQLLCYLVQWL